MDSHLSKKLPDRSAERDQRLWSKTMKDLEQKPRIFSQAMLGIKKILARHEVVPDNKKRRVCMLRKIIILMIGAILFQTQIAEATGQAPWAPAACKSLVQGSVTITTHAAGELMPAFGVVDGVQNATVEMAHTAPYYFFGKDETFYFSLLLFHSFILYFKK